MDVFANVGAVDLVRMGSILLFVPTEDNLYDRFVPDAAKHYSLEKMVRDLSAEPPTDPTGDVTKVMEQYLALLFARGQKVHVLDIGAWVGDVAVRWAKFAADRRAPFTAACYDPSLAGRLIPFNATLNGVGDRVSFHPVAVSNVAGVQLFLQRKGNSDSSALVDGPQATSEDTYPVRTVMLADLIDGAACDHLIAKIDVEGLEAKLVLPNLGRLANVTMILEFAPRQPQYADIGPVNYLRVLQATHTLVDLFYLPRPTRADIISDPERFFVEVMTTRPYGYTDVLAVPKSLPVHDEMLSLLRGLSPITPSYMMVA